MTLCKRYKLLEIQEALSNLKESRVKGSKDEVYKSNFEREWRKLKRQRNKFL